MKTTQEMIEVMQAFADGKPVECKTPRGGWVSTDNPIWNWASYDYRIATTPDTINWDHVAPQYKWMARGENGFAFLFKEEPFIDGRYWYAKNTIAQSVISFTSYKRGTVNWRDSLVERPK